MREAVGNTYMLGVVITFLAIFIIVFAGSIGYSKAFKARNQIVAIIERTADTTSAAKFDINKIIPKINTALSDVGYRVVTGIYQDCPTVNGQAAINTISAYRYCLYLHTTPKGNYYSVIAYMYFEFPIIGSNIELPIYGETKLLYQLN